MKLVRSDKEILLFTPGIFMSRVGDALPLSTN